ncbi:hypothetical protein MHBO_001016 [Bonamia ostreae]|uniref:Uncharacterized protein n=1 Tax=Bonamia ostreae TaxID=126728 RepID=A0ABV2AHR7_9EUKA
MTYPNKTFFEIHRYVTLPISILFSILYPFLFFCLKKPFDTENIKHKCRLIGWILSIFISVVNIDFYSELQHLPKMTVSLLKLNIEFLNCLMYISMAHFMLMMLFEARMSPNRKYVKKLDICVIVVYIAILVGLEVFCFIFENLFFVIYQFKYF